MAHVAYTAGESLLFWACAALLLATILFLGIALRPGLRSIPGPFLAKFTDLWRLRAVWTGHFERVVVELHQKYGVVVRVGPNAISIADPKAIESIYGLKANFPKSKFYNAFMAVNNGKPVETFFTTQDIGYHSAIKRPVSSAYSMTTITDYEPHIDVIMERLLRRLEAEFCTEDQVLKQCDIGQWLHFYSFDVISEMTWSSSFGFLEQGTDIDGMIRSLEADMDYYAPVGQMPWIDNFLRKNLINRYITKKSSTFAKLGVNKIRERRAKGTLSSREERDFLSKFLRASKAHPHTVDDKEIVSYMITNIVAGSCCAQQTGDGGPASSDTTAISLRSVLYYLLKNPATYKKLQEEIDTAGLLDGPVSWKNSQNLPYLDACVKEAFRMHPAVGLLLERLTPTSYQLPSGQNIPAGTIVGMNAWSVHRNPEIFGDRVDEYVPERWLQQLGEDEDVFRDRVKRMKRADLTFGYGTRTCLGKNIGLMETYKTIPTLLRAFDVGLVDPDAEWTLKNAWFVRQAGFKVYLKRRSGQRITTEF